VHIFVPVPGGKKIDSISRSCTLSWLL